jgi:hypothetical protein
MSSLFIRLQEWEEITDNKLGVVTKVPKEEGAVTPAMFGVITEAYKKALRYAETNIDAISDDLMLSGLDVSMVIPDLADIRHTSGDWLPIYDDRSGSVDVLHRLLSFVTEEDAEVPSPRVQIINFGEEKNNPNLINYTQLSSAITS